MPSARQRPQGFVTIATIVGLELRLHGRDFMAWLGALAFFFLALAHATGGPISLVSGALAQLPRTAEPVLAQAMAGLTAFGQVITAMTAATVGLRDVSLRSEGLVLTTGIAWHDYLLGRFAATLAVLLLISVAIPLGFALGGAAPADLLRPMLLLVLPNVVLVAAAFFAAAALSGGFSVILLVGLGFVGLWQTGLNLITRGLGVGTLVDPFGNAALTAGHSLAANRFVWTAISGTLLGITLWRWRPRGGLSAARSVAASPSSVPATPVGEARSLAPLRGAATMDQCKAEYAFGLHWVLKERGFAVLLFLALLNAIANGWSVATDASSLIRALEFHARLFAILIATIYAGELVWRDRDVRADALLNALPSNPDLRLASRAAGVLTTLLALPLTITTAAVLLPLLRSGTPNVSCAATWLGGVGSLLFAGLFIVSLAVHRVVQHKPAAHLLLIAAWVGAIAAGVDALARPWQLWGLCP
jgi:hypothetical protein